MHFKSGIKKYHSYSTLNLWHKMRFKKKKRKKFTLHSASSFLFFPQSECFCVSSQLPLFLMVSAGARQGARWQVGYRQWYWFHYSSSHCLPAWLTAAPIQHFTFCLCRAVVTNTQSCKQGENKEERGVKKKEESSLVRSHSRVHTNPPGAHTIQQLKTTHTQTHAHLPSMLHKWSPAISFSFPSIQVSSPPFLSPSFTLSGRHPSISLFFLTRISESRTNPVTSPTRSQAHTHARTRSHTRSSLQAPYICVKVWVREGERECECRECMQAYVCVCVYETNSVCVYVCICVRGGEGGEQGG